MRMPLLDQMANEGLRLTNFFSQPAVGPARAVLMTRVTADGPPIRDVQPIGLGVGKSAAFIEDFHFPWIGVRDRLFRVGQNWVSRHVLTTRCQIVIDLPTTSKPRLLARNAT